MSDLLLAPAPAPAPRQRPWTVIPSLTLTLTIFGGTIVVHADRRPPVDGGVPADGGLPAAVRDLAGVAAPDLLGPGPAPATFLGTPDDEILRRLCEQPVTKLEFNYRGTTIKFKATLADGTVASLRPAQGNEAGYFRADVAAYRLSRALGLGAVAPSCLRTLPRAAILGAVGPGPLAGRLATELQWDAGGQTLQVSMVVWVERIRPGGLDKDMDAWRPLLLQSRALAAAPPRLQSRAAAGGRLMAWDFLIANWDRWSGGNTFHVGNDGPWVWLDNAAGFGHYSPPVRRYNEAQLRPVERYSRSFIAALRQISPEQLAAELAPAGLPPLALRQLLERRDVLLRRVEMLVARYGEAQVLCFE
ncbi:MAG TPA: hypothetical protein VH877_28580 [Polyangia bacterium]|nr:hypothetical protein [Polyangia bacterium]